VIAVVVRARARARRLVDKVREEPRLVVVPALVVLYLVLLVWRLDPVVAASLVLLLLGCVAVPHVGEEPSYAYGLPGVPDGPPRASTVPKSAHTAVSAVVTAVAVVLAVLDAPWWAFVALVVVAAPAWAYAADSAIRFARQTRRLRRALVAYAPSTAMGYAGRSGGPWQLRMWEPYILRSGERTVVYNVHAKYAPMILEEARLSSPFIQFGSRGTDDFDALVVPSIKAMFYVQNAWRNAAFMEHKEITHVWLNHGDSDKPANFNPRHATYDVLVVCGQAGIDRYERHGIHVDPHKFEILGRPQASGVEPARGPISEREPKVVLYAPTWQGLNAAVNFSSLEKGPRIVEALLERGATVIFRPHPLSHRWRIRRAVIAKIHAILAADRAATGREHVWGDQAEKTWGVVECANHADALISDVSSVVSDFLQSEKPYCMTSMHGPVDEFRAEFSVAETGYVLLGDLSNLDAVLEDLLEKDPLAQARSERKRYVLGDFVGNESADAFAEYVRTLVGRVPGRAGDDG
jgi:hypothetical protein